MRALLLGFSFTLLSLAVPAQCPPDFVRDKPFSTDVELRVGADAIRIQVRTMHSGFAAEIWRKEADQDQDGHLSGPEVKDQIALARATILECGIFFEVGDVGDQEVKDLSFENCTSNIGVEADDPVSFQFDFVARGFVPVAGRTYSGTLVYSNPFISASVVHTSVVAEEGVRFLSTPGSLAKSATFATGRGLSGEISFVVKDRDRLPVGRDETRRPGLLSLLLGALGYVVVLILVTRRC